MSKVAVATEGSKAYRTIRNFDPETTLSIWLMRIVIEEPLVRLRKASRPDPGCNQHLVPAQA
jgi:DNA-directed RNA polymerase specialized sigma24 family protein